VAEFPANRENIREFAHFRPFGAPAVVNSINNPNALRANSRSDPNSEIFSPNRQFIHRIRNLLRLISRAALPSPIRHRPVFA